MTKRGWTVVWLDSREGNARFDETFRTKKLAVSFASLLRRRPDVTNLVIVREGDSAYGE